MGSSIQLLRNSEVKLKARLIAKESELQSMNTEKEIQSIGTTEEVDTISLSKAMSQIGLKDTKLVKLRKQVEEVEKERVKEKQGKERAEEKCRELTQQNDKLIQQVIGKISLQGTKHLIWDQIIIEADKFRPYLCIIEYLDIAMKEAKRQVQIVEAEVNKKPLETVENSITYLSSLLDEASCSYGIQNRVVVVSAARKVIAKHWMRETV